MEFDKNLMDLALMSMMIETGAEDRELMKNAVHQAYVEYPFFKPIQEIKTAVENIRCMLFVNKAKENYFRSSMMRKRASFSEMSFMMKRYKDKELSLHAELDSRIKFNSPPSSAFPQS